jgi:hypothetical protein
MKCLLDSLIQGSGRHASVGPVLVKYLVKVVKSGETREMPDPEILPRFEIRNSCTIKNVRYSAADMAKIMQRRFFLNNPLAGKTKIDIFMT